MKEKKKLSPNVKAYIISLIVIFALMGFSYVLTLVVPAGSYARTTDASGNSIIDTSAEFEYTEGGISFWRWLASPILVLGADGNALLIAILAFLLVIGGSFAALEKCGIFKYMLFTIVNKFGRKRYILMAVLIFFFMAMGSLVGSFEEVVPLTPIVVSLAVALGWDKTTGFAMSLLAAGCGFAAGVMNPFSVGVAQELAGLPMFSGVWYRAVAFVLIYLLLTSFTMYHARAVNHPMIETDAVYVHDKQKSGALTTFAVILGVGILVVLSSPILTFLQDYTMIIIAVMFLIAGIAASLVAGMKIGDLAKSFGGGVVGMLPAVLMILMASSVRFTLEDAGTMDSILHGIVGVAEKVPSAVIILFIYLIVLVMNFFVASGSAKAFMIMPIIVPIAQLFNVSPQLCVMAYAFGDGFSNVFYPTNPALLIGLNISGESYGSWARWSFKFQLANIVLTSGLLMLGVLIGY